MVVEISNPLTRIKASMTTTMLFCSPVGFGCMHVCMCICVYIYNVSLYLLIVGGCEGMDCTIEK